MISLKITPVPFKSSNLAIPPSPFSPKSPLTPLPRPTQSRYSVRRSRELSSPPKIAAPLQWMWQCHRCRQTYPLGATRRCLEDGHEFCAGTSVVKSRKTGNKKIVKKHRACASEFDYAAWKTIGDWKRDCLQPPTPTMKGKKDCWRNCNYPSECRWGHNNKTEEKAEQYSPTIPISPPDQKPVEVEEVREMKKQQAPATTFDALLSAINHPILTLQSRLSASGRKKSVEKSPLKLHTVYEVDEEDDVPMPDVSPGLPSPLNKATTHQASEQSQAASFDGFRFGFEEDTVMANRF